MDDTAERHLGARVARTARLGGFAVVVGVLAGLSSAAFLVALEWVTEERLDHPSLLFLLPLAGLGVGLVYHYGGGRSVEGSNQILDEIHEPTDWVPRRMAPMIFVGTCLTQLFGGSAGREGAAIQMSGSLTDLSARTLRLRPEDRRVLLVASISGAFGAMFGVPFAGAVFGLEVQRTRRRHLPAVLPCLVASIVGDRVVRALGVHHEATPALHVALTFTTAAKVVLAAVAFGLAGTVFSVLTHSIKHLFERALRWAPARPLVGGVLVIVVTLLLGTRAYNGLSIGLVESSLFGGDVATWAFGAKLLLTALTLGAGFVGGEVTPLFVVGATLGATLGTALHVPTPLLAALGFVAVFAGAANAPVSCIVLGMELFGVSAAPYLALACLVSFAASSHRGLYTGDVGRSALVPWAVVAARRRRPPVAEIP